MAVLQVLLDHKADIAATAAEGTTALRLAAQQGHTAAARVLLDAGADVDAADSLHQTALYYAAANGHADTVAVLLSKGRLSTAQRGGLLAALRHREHALCCALHAAAQRGHVAVLQVLLDQGADVSEATAAGTTALHLAAQEGHTAAAHVLVDAGADEQAADSNGSTPLHYAALHGHADTVSALLSAAVYVNTGSGQQHGLTPLHVAAHWGHAAVLQVLLGHKADVAATTVAGTTALHLAAQEGHTAAAQLLTNAGADVQAADSTGSTALYLAAANDHVDTLVVLLSAAGLHTAKDNGMFPLHAAAKRGHLCEVQLLLDHGADVNATATKPAQDPAARLDNSSEAALLAATASHVAGATALHVTAQEGHTSAAQLLLAAGAKVEAVDSLGRTALFCAALYGHADTAALLLSAAASLNQSTERGSLLPLHAAAYSGHTAPLQALLDAGADVSAGATMTLMGGEGTTALHFAAPEGHAAAAQLLLDAGAGVKAADRLGRTALHHAARNGHADVVRVALDRGAVVNAVTAAGATPLLYAAQQRQLAVVDLLLLAGADPNVAHESGMLPVQVAVENQNGTVLRRLLQANADCNAPTAPLDLGDSLLAVAATYDSVAVVEARLAAGARSSSAREFGHDALQLAVALEEGFKLQLAMVVALLSYEHSAPSVASTRAALVRTIQTGLYDISARLLLHLHQAAQQQGISQDDAVSPVSAAQPVQDRGSDERAHTSLSLLRAWTAHSAGTAAAGAELAGQEQEVAAVRQGARDLMVQTTASQAAAAAATRVAGPVRRCRLLQSLPRVADPACAACAFATARISRRNNGVPSRLQHGRKEAGLSQAESALAAGCPTPTTARRRPVQGCGFVTGLSAADDTPAASPQHTLTGLWLLPVPSRCSHQHNQQLCSADA